MLAVKNSSANDGDVLFLGQEDLLEAGMATHCGILAWRSTVHSVAESETTEMT